eukprot:7084715-Karenia_brevis.AAC.1
MGDGSGAAGSSRDPGASSGGGAPDQSGGGDRPESEPRGSDEPSHGDDGDVDLGQMDSLEVPDHEKIFNYDMEAD